jgi:hypothetical protein
MRWGFPGREGKERKEGKQGAGAGFAAARVPIATQDGLISAQAAAP